MIKGAIEKLVADSAFKSRPVQILQLVDNLLASPAPQHRVYRSWLSSLTPLSNAGGSLDTQLSTRHRDFMDLLRTRYSLAGRSRDLMDIESMRDIVDRDLTIVGNMCATYGQVDHASRLFEVAIARSQERNALFSLAQIVQYSELVVAGGKDASAGVTRVGAACLYHAAASTGGHPEAMFNLSLLISEMVADGAAGVVGDDAAYWMRKASEHGLKSSLTPLARLIHSSHPGESVKYLVDASKAGDALANLILGSYAVSVGNLDAAVGVWTSALKMELDIETWPLNKRAIAECFSRLGCLHFLGLYPSASDGDIDYMGNAEMFLRKSQVKDVDCGAPNYALASEYWRMASDVDPMFHVPDLLIGSLHLDGLTRSGVDLELACSHYEKAFRSIEKAMEFDPSTSAKGDLELAKGLVLLCNTKLGNANGLKERRPFLRRILREDSSMDEREKMYMNSIVEVDTNRKLIEDAAKFRWRLAEEATRSIR